MEIKEYIIKVNQNITIPYIEAATAGFLWDFEKKQNVVSLQVKRENIKPELFGAFTKGNISVTGLKKGEIFFNHKRPWKKGDSGDKQINIKVE